MCESALSSEDSIRYFAVSPGALAESKSRLVTDKSLQSALNVLVKAADKALNEGPLSVMDKTRTPPSGDKHDYMSIAPYFWPDPGKSNGLPYIRHDGKINPDSNEDEFDAVRIGKMANNLNKLALAYYFTGNEAYAAQAAKYLRVWFLDPATRMNPNMKFAQAVPGVNTGRGFGILEGLPLARAADATGLLAGSPMWTAKDQADFNTWVETYLNWLLTSQPGRDAAAAQNNHGTWYDVQVVELALVVGRVELAKQICEAAKNKRILPQITMDGQQPEELARTAAFTYSCYNLAGFYRLATLAEHVGVDLWHYQLANGRYALAAALDFLLPYADPAKKWPYEQIRKFDRTAFAAQLCQAIAVYREPKYEKVFTGFPEATKNQFELLYPANRKPPVQRLTAPDPERLSQ
jgi:hypothetical protein